jgi:hypothetical protein
MYIMGQTPALPFIGIQGVNHRKYSPHAPPMLADGGVPPPSRLPGASMMRPAIV